MITPYAERRFERGVGPEPRDYRSVTVWSCPVCGSEMLESDGGMYCGSCDERFPWAKLRDGG
jgi:rubrerythrin